MKKGLLTLFLVTLVASVFAQSPQTTITAVKDGDLLDITITWKPAEDYWTEVYIRGNFDGDQWAPGQRMTRNPDGTWSYTIKGKKIGEQFKYKFFANDTWIDEADNYPATTGNPFGGVDGLVIVDESLLTGTVVKLFQPRLAFAANLPSKFVYQDQAGADALLRLDAVGWFKLTADIMPQFSTYIQFNLVGASGDKSVDIWKEASGLERKFFQLFANGPQNFDMGRVAKLTHLEVKWTGLEEIGGPFIAYVAGYRSFIKDGFLGKDGYVFTVHRTEPANSAGGNGGTFVIRDDSVDFGGGVSLSYSLTWGANARHSWSRFEPGWGSVAEWNLSGIDWDNMANWGSAQYSTVNYAYVRTPVIDFMLSYTGILNGISPAGTSLNKFGTDGHLGVDNLKNLSSQFVLGFKQKIEIVEYAVQSYFQFAPGYLYVKDDKPTGASSQAQYDDRYGGTWGIGKYATIGAKVNLDLSPVTLFFRTVFVGRDHQIFFNYDDFGYYSEDGYVNVLKDGLKGLMRFELNGKFSSDFLSVGLDNSLKGTSILNDLTSAPKDYFYNGKLFGGINFGAAGNLDLYGKFFYNIWETTPPNVTSNVGLDSAGIKYSISQVVPDVINSIGLSYAIALYGTTTSLTTDDAMNHSIVLTAGLPFDVTFNAAVGIVTGETVSNMTDNQTNVVYGFGVKKAISVFGNKATDSHIFLAVTTLNELFADEEKKADLKLDDFKIDKLGSQPITKLFKFVLGAYIDF